MDQRLPASQTKKMLPIFWVSTELDFSGLLFSDWTQKRFDWTQQNQNKRKPKTEIDQNQRNKKLRPRDSIKWSLILLSLTLRKLWHLSLTIDQQWTNWLIQPRSNHFKPTCQQINTFDDGKNYFRLVVNTSDSTDSQSLLFLCHSVYIVLNAYTALDKYTIILCVYIFEFLVSLEKKICAHALDPLACVPPPHFRAGARADARRPIVF